MAIALLRCLLVVVGLVGLLPEPAQAGATPVAVQGEVVRSPSILRAAHPAEPCLAPYRPALFQGTGAPILDVTTPADQVLAVRPPHPAVLQVLRPSSTGALGGADPVRLDRPPKHG